MRLDPSHMLATYLARRGQAAEEALRRIDPDYLLSENPDVLIASLVREHAPVAVVVDWDGATSSGVIESSMRVYDEWDRTEQYIVPSSKLTVKFPVTGDVEMLNYDASHAYLGQARLSVRGSQLELVIEERTLGSDQVQKLIASFRENIERRVGWANADLAGFTTALEGTLRTRLEERRRRLLNDRQVEAALGIPVRIGPAPRMPVTAQRKQVSLAQRRAQAGFVPEPVLEEATYNDILTQVRAWANTLERMPKAPSKLSEEDLRDLLLGTLNGYWIGQAGGELFNGAGRTDILIREDDRNVFIGECKVWSGEARIGPAIDQLLSYMVWRDAKAALIMFIKRSDPAAVCAKLDAAVRAHPNYVQTQASVPRNMSRHIFSADREGRRVALAVIPVALPPRAGQAQT